MKKLTRDELVTALRCCTTTINCNGCPLEPPENYDHCMIEIDVQAADMLENHETERLALVKVIEKLRKQVDELTKAGLIATDKANQAIAERDVAVEALHGNCHVCNNYTPYHNQGKCRFCCYEICRSPDCEVNDNWEWRGPQKEA